jgi:mRNA interferase RelE/StbE
MSYRLIIKPAAQRDMRRLQPAVQRRILARLGNIEADPRGSGSVKLARARATYRVRVGDWRIVYEIDDARLMVFVTIVAHRREVYRGL